MFTVFAMSGWEFQSSAILKQKGDSLYITSRFTDARETYTAGIRQLTLKDSHSPADIRLLAALHSNRSHCHFDLGDCASAIQDSKRALELLHADRALELLHAFNTPSAKPSTGLSEYLKEGARKSTRSKGRNLWNLARNFLQTKTSTYQRK